MNWVLEVTEHARPTYGCSLPHLWLQPVPHMVAACPTYGCSLSHLWLQVTDHATLGEEPERPDVLISGALHGDEQVGPVTTIVRVRVRARVRVRGRDNS